MTRAEVVAEARSWLGVSFRPKGRSRRGVDCIGLLVVVGQAFAVAHVDQQHYTDWPDPTRRILTELDRFLERRPSEEDWDGTIGVFTTHQSLPGHVGIFSTRHNAPHLIHARMQQRVVLEQVFDNDPRTRSTQLVARYGFPGLV